MKAIALNQISIRGIVMQYATLLCILNIIVYNSFLHKIQNINNYALGIPTLHKE